MAARDLVFTILGIDKASDSFTKVGAASDKLGDKLGSFGKVSAGVLGAMPALATGAGVAVAGALSAVAIGFAAAGVAVVAGNAKVQTAWTSLTDTVTSGAKDMAAPLEGHVVDALGKLQGTVVALKPQLRDAFSASGPAVTELAGAVDGFARSAMPGMVTAVKASQPALAGLRSFATDTGLGLNDFFTRISASAGSSGRILADFGRIGRDALGFVGGLLANLSNSGAPSVERLRQVLSQLFTTVQGLSSGGFPVLFSTAGMVLNVLSGILGVVGPIATQLGGVLGVVISVAGAFRLLNTVTGTLQTVGAGVADFASKLGAAGENAGGAKSKFGVLTSFIGGPLGIALGVGAVAFGLFGQKQAEAATRATDLASALRASKGAIDGNVRSVAAKNLQDMGALTLAKSLGISLSDVTDAYLGQGRAATELLPALKAIQERYSLNVGGEVGIDETAEAAMNLAAMLRDLQPGSAKAIEDAKLLAAAQGESASSTRDLSTAQLGARATAAQMSADFATLADTAGDVNARVSALQRLMDELTGKQTSYEDATQALNETLRSLGDQFNANTDRTKGWGDKLLNADGTVSTLNENGAALRNTLKELETNTLAGADAMARNGATQQQVAGYVQNARDRFVDQHAAMGLTREQAGRLADQYGLIPETVSTLIMTPNLLEKVKALGDFNWQVTHLDNGNVIIEAHTGAAQDQITRLIQTNDGRVITIRVQANGDVQALNARGAAIGLPARAAGGPIEAGRTYITGEEGIELITPSVNGYVYSNDDTMRMLNGRGTTALSTSNGSPTTKNFYLTLQNVGNREVDLVEQFRRMELLDMPVGG